MAYLMEMQKKKDAAIARKARAVCEHNTPEEKEILLPT